MITRKSFFIRWLLVRNEKEEQQEEKSVIDVEHIQSGSKCRLSNMEEAGLWMQEIEADNVEKQKLRRLTKVKNKNYEKNI